MHPDEIYHRSRVCGIDCPCRPRVCWADSEAGAWLAMALGLGGLALGWWLTTL